MKKINISLPKKKSDAVSSKRTMNFVHHESSFNAKKVIPIALVLGIAASVFVKIAIVDKVNEMTLAELELSSRQEQLSTLQMQLSDYNEVAEEYGRYSYDWMTDSELNTVDRMKVLGLIEEKITPFAVVENVGISGETISLSLHGITLEVGGLVCDSLRDVDFVADARINNANTDENGESHLSMSITLQKEAAEE